MTYTQSKRSRRPLGRRRIHRGGTSAVLLVLLGLAGMANAVSPTRTEAPQTRGEQFITAHVVEAPTWQSGYVLIDGSDDYAVGVVDITPNEEVAGEVSRAFEEWDPEAAR